MNRMYLPKRPRKARHRREAPVQIELTLELPRGPQASEPMESREEQAERGIAEIDFFI
jgi:hypothetical protein